MRMRTGLIIGATGGIGRALVARMAAQSWRLILAGRNQAALCELADSVGAVAGPATAYVEVVDAEDATAMSDLVSRVAGRVESLDAAVNLAGSILLKPAHSTSAGEFEAVLRCNLLTAFNLVRAAGQAMRAGGGSVVLISSCAARVGLANHEAISAAKAGIEGLVRSAAATYAPTRLRFNAVAPGLVQTPLSARLTGNPQALAASTAMHPLGRIGTADEVARVVEFLLDPASEWISGQVFGVDGGLAALRPREKM